MKISLQNFLLALIAVLLGVIALRPYTTPPPVLAQGEPYHVYIEPGSFPLYAPNGRALQQGRVVIDLTNGNIWGYPTIAELPYPKGIGPDPPVSKPMYLGKFDFSEMRKR